MNDDDATVAAAAAARGALLGFLLRILSFALTQLTVRLVDPETLGRANIRLELLLSTSLFLGREGFRLALTKTASDGSMYGEKDGTKTANSVGRGCIPRVEDSASAEQRTVNVAWLTLPVGLVTTSVALFLHQRSCRALASHVAETSSGDVNDSPEYYTPQSLLDLNVAGVLFCLAAVVEMIAEPLVIGCMRTLDFGTRAKAEGSAAVAKGACLIALLSRQVIGFIFPGSDIPGRWPVSAFGMSHVVHSAVLVSVLYWRKRGKVRWPRAVPESSLEPPSGCAANVQPGGGTPVRSVLQRNFDAPSLRLSAVFTAQSFFKHALTEGDRIVLTTLAGSYDQGVYAMASSYGGMASRLLLQPLEENARLLFSRQNSTLMLSSEAKVGAAERKDAAKVRQIDSSIKRSLDALNLMYVSVLRLVLYVGLLFACVASNYTSVLLRILAGRTWGGNPDASQSLSAFCVYTALLALNGMSEAFVYGVAAQGRDVGEIGLVHATVGVAFAATAPALVGQLGTIGLIWANCAAMALRSMYSLHFAARYFQRWKQESGSDVVVEKQGLATSALAAVRLTLRVIPHSALVLAFICSFLVTRLSRLRLEQEEEVLDLSAGLTKVWLVAAARHVSVAVGCLFFLMALLYCLERDFGRMLRSIVRKKQD